MTERKSNHLSPDDAQPHRRVDLVDPDSAPSFHEEANEFAAVEQVLSNEVDHHQLRAKAPLAHSLPHADAAGLGGEGDRVAGRHAKRQPRRGSRGSGEGAGAHTRAPRSNAARTVHPLKQDSC